MEEENLFFRITEMLARQNPKVAALLDQGAEVRSSLERQLNEAIQRREDDKKQRRWNFYREFCDVFEKTPVESRKQLIEFNEGVIEKKIIESRINLDDFGIQENEELLLTLKAFYSLIQKIPFRNNEVIKNDVNNRSFVLKTSISPDSINNMRKSLITSGFIASETTAVQFRSAFTKSGNTKKVEWNKKGVLKYFIEQLLLKKSIFLEVPRDHWKIVEANYIVNGKVLDATKFRKVNSTSSRETRNKVNQALENLHI